VRQKRAWWEITIGVMAAMSRVRYRANLFVARGAKVAKSGQ